MLKSKLRKKILKLREKNNKRDVQINFNQLIKILKKEKINKKVIGGYYPVNFEMDDLVLLKRSRAFGNLVEHAPLMIILLMLMEYSGNEFFVHIFGIGFILSRISHAYGLIAEEGLGPDNLPRMVGALGSWTIMILASLMCIF